VWSIAAEEASVARKEKVSRQNAEGWNAGKMVNPGEGST
jgi:hypothetical protein